MANKEQKGNVNKKKEPKMTLKEKRAIKQEKKNKKNG
jgi:hypothetical protein